MRMRMMFVPVVLAFTLTVAAPCCFCSAAQWIAGGYQRPDVGDEQAFYRETPNDVLLRTVELAAKPVTHAVWRVAAPGMRDLFVNGTRVTPTALPPWTVYAKRVLEESFEVTDLVKSGTANELRIELGNGWWNLTPLLMWYTYDLRKILPQGTPCVRATLEISYADGTQDKVVTDTDWSAASGRIVRNCLYLGVREDARRGLTPTGAARVVEGPAGRIVPADDFPKTIVYANWKARSVSPAGTNAWLVDMGVNAAGNFRVRLRDMPAGTLVRFRSGERQYTDGTLNPMTAVAGQIKNPKRGPLFAVAEQCDEWVADGSAEAIFEPRLTFHVFRYIQVEGLPYRPRPEDFEMRAWSADVKDASHFTCSDARLNNLHAVCRRTFRSNLQSVQSDCPGREKFGYLGDIACTAESLRANYAMLPFYRKVVRDALDEAEDDGLITETVPFVGIASRSVYPDKGSEGQMVAKGKTRAAPMGWATGLPVLLDVIVRYDGDLELLAEAYPALVRFIAKLTERYPDDDLPDCLGDWIAVEKADCGLSCLAHWYEFLTKTARFARLLGKDADAAAFTAHAERVAAKFRQKYVKPDGLVNTGKQGEQLFALYQGLLDPKDERAAYARLKADIAAHGDSLTTGIFTTQYLFEYLSSHGDAELAGRVATHEGAPGYFHMIERGATTLWEDWFEKKCENAYSNCHPMFGSIEQWFLRYVVGIAVCEDAVGCDKVRICPHAVAGLTSASGWLDTPKGRITVSWRLVNGKMKVERSIPPGITVVGGGAAPMGEFFDFAEGRWDRSRWLSPRNPDWDRGTPMVQEKDGLVNWSDPAWTDEEIFKKHQIDTFSALVLTNVYSGKVTCTTETSFDHRMAPSLVLVKEMTKDAQGRDQLIDFYEIVLYDGGLNIWHHKPHPGDGVQHIPIDKVAWLVTRFEPKTRYDLSMTVERKMHRGRPTGQMTVRCGGHEVGFSDALLPEKFRVGILGSEGRCRFYSFKVTSGN